MSELCPVCSYPLDPAAGDIHPSCENTRSARHIRRTYPGPRLRDFTHEQWAKIRGSRRRPTTR